MHINWQLPTLINICLKRVCFEETDDCKLFCQGRELDKPEKYGARFNNFLKTDICDYILLRKYENVTRNTSNGIQYVGERNEAW